MNTIITIGRQCGSGGHTLGKMVSERLGIPFYDKEIIKAVSQRSGLTEHTVETEGEYSTTSLLLNVATRGISGFDVASKNNMLIRDIVNAYQTEYIMELADRVMRVIAEHSIDPAVAEKYVLERDRKRAKYYRHITDQLWGLAENYDLCLNSSSLGIDGCATLIMDCCK